MQYYSTNWDRGTNKLRDGSRRMNSDRDRWTKALAGHTRDAHKGKVLENCPACRELKLKIG